MSRLREKLRRGVWAAQSDVDYATAKARQAGGSVRDRLSDIDRDRLRKQLDRAQGLGSGNPRTGGQSSRTRQMFDDAADATEMGAPIDATLDPLTNPEETDQLARGNADMGSSSPTLDDMAYAGSGDDGGDMESFVVGGTSGKDDSPLFTWGSDAEEGSAEDDLVGFQGDTDDDPMFSWGED